MVIIFFCCVSGLVKFLLFLLICCVFKIGKNFFKLFKNYVKVGVKVGENFEMVLFVFKVNDFFCVLDVLGLDCYCGVFYL